MSLGDEEDAFVAKRRKSNTVLLIELCFTLALGCGDDGPDGGVGNEDEEVRAEAPRLTRMEFLADDNLGK